MATWAWEGESEFFNRWLVVGVPLGAGSWCHRCCLRSSSLRRLQGRSHWLCWHGALFCQGELFFSHPKLESPLPTSHTAFGPPTREVRSLSPTPCPLSSGATFHSHLSPVLSDSLFASLLRTASTQIPLTLAVILCSTLARSGHTPKRRNSVLFFI